jgi:hypothetical protein
MPTHKLWIEHTERAAWQSVQALREKLAEAERHAERMAPPIEGWRELFAALDAARESHALAGATYADLIAAVLERLTRAEAERRVLEARLAGEPLRPVLTPEPLPRRRHSTGGLVGSDDDELAAGRPNRSERQFFREIRQRDRELAKERPRPDPELELGDIERRLADLPELDPAEIMDIAADLAALALHLQPAHDDLDDD